MAELENVKWRFFTEEEKQAIREEFKKLDEEESDLDPDEIIDWQQLDLDKAYKVISKITIYEFAKIHDYVFFRKH